MRSVVEAPRFPREPMSVNGVDVVAILRQREFELSLRRILSNSQVYEQEEVVGLNLNTQRSVIRRPTYGNSQNVERDSVYRKMERNSEIPLIAVHSHGLAYGNSWAFVPSLEDIVRSGQIPLHDGTKLIYCHIVGSLVLPTRKLDVWIWQAVEDAKQAARIERLDAMWEASIVDGVRTDDIRALEEDLRSEGVNLIRGRLDPNNIGASFADLVVKGNFMYGIRSIEDEE